MQLNSTNKKISPITPKKTSTVNRFTKVNSYFQGAPADIGHLHRALSARIAVSKRPAPASGCSVSATSQQAAERLEAAADDADFERADSDPADAKPDKRDASDRLDSPRHETEEYESNVDGMKEDPEARSLKRKEQPDDDTSPKRPRPELTAE